MQAVMQDIKRLLAMAIRQPEPNPYGNLEAALAPGGVTIDTRIIR